jgi:TfoX/Sxy family transcriptional regulator of competence genes
MPYDPKLADRIRRALGTRTAVTEKAMFGGLAFLLEGKMFCGIVKNDLMVRVGPDRYEESLARPHVRPMDFTRKPMKGYVFVGPKGCRTPRLVRSWVDRGASFVTTVGPSRAPRSNRARSRGAGKTTTFSATLFRYPGPGGWTFARVPDKYAPPTTHGWGRTPVKATVDGQSWDTSVWRDKQHGTLLPVPKRLLADKRTGDRVSVELGPRDA